MWGYALALLTTGCAYLAYHIKKNVLDFDKNIVDSSSKSRKWVPSPEEENLDHNYQPVSSTKRGSDHLIFCGGDAKGNLVSLGIERTSHNTAQVKACLWLQDGRKLETFEDTEEFSPCLDWTCGGFSFQMIEPLSLWRIVVNSVLKCGNTYVHVNMRFMWKASSLPIYLHETLQQQLYYSIDERPDSLQGHDQYGSLSGTVIVGGVNHVIHYLSVKHRDWSSHREVYVQSDHEQIFTLNFSGGSCIGHFHKCNKAFDVLKPSGIENRDGITYVSITMPNGSCKLYCLNRKASSGNINVVNDQFSFNFNSFMGDDSQYKSMPPLCQIEIPQAERKLIVSLHDIEAMNASAVGGKAANLAILKRLSHEKKIAFEVILLSIKTTILPYLSWGHETGRRPVSRYSLADRELTSQP